MWIDSHAHLGDVDDRRLSVLLSEARDRGVNRILNVATSLLSSNAVLRQAGIHRSLIPAVGISPFDVTAESADWLARLTALAAAPSVAAIGETGLDTTNPRYPSLQLQRFFFESQLGLCVENELPVVVHSRGCEQQVLDLCRTTGVRLAVFHCYTGPLEVLKRILDSGYIVSFSGIITFKNSLLSPLVSYTPLSQMLIETDSPYLAPVPHRGSRNQPAWVVYVGKTVAAIKNIDEEECGRGLSETFSRIFGQPRR
jgi:TatD DNase family protein